MKKIFAILLSACLLFSVLSLSGCDYHKIVEEEPKGYAMLNDFEESSEFDLLRLFGVLGKVEKNTNAEYVTSGNASAKILIFSNPYKKQAPYMEQAFELVKKNEDYRNFENVAAISFDLYNPSQNTLSVGLQLTYKESNGTEMGYYYSFDYGPLHFVSSLSNDIFYHYDGKYTKAQLNWLREDLAEARENPEIKWIVMMTHHGIMTPTFSKVVSGAFNPITYAQLMPILDEYDVDLLLYGHNHYLDSTYPIVWSNEIEKTVYEDYEYIQDYVDYYKIEMATNTTKKTIHDGVEVDEFVYADGVTNRGTVMHQTACVGDQWNTTFKLAELQENLAKRPNYRMLLSGGVGAIDSGVGYSMYSYVEVQQDKLVCRTYGVDIVSQYSQPSLENGKYLDGFLLRK